jgi:endonuclease/exonuclease/phosphatase family metal-dependent hydrolase
MALVNLPSVKNAKSLEEVIDAVEKMRKEMEFLFDNVENDNIRGQIEAKKIIIGGGTTYEEGHEPASPEEINQRILVNYKTYLETSKKEIDAKYAAKPVPKTTLKVATWNIHGGKNENSVYIDLSKLPRDLIASGAYDIVGMQEVLVNGSQSITKWPNAALGPGYGQGFFQAITLENGVAKMGNGLLIKKYGIGNPVNTNLPNGGYENRVLSQSEFILNGKKFYVFVTHLTYQSLSVRTSQMQFIKNKLDSLNGASFILMGDFNVESTSEYNLFSPTYQFVNGLGGTYYDTYRTGDWPTNRIDNIICSKDFTVSSRGMVSTSLSDHNLLWASLTISETGTLKEKKDAFDSKYNDVITAINTAIADGKTTDAEKAAVEGKITLLQTALADLGVSFELSTQEIANTTAQEYNNNNNDSVRNDLEDLRGNMRSTGPLPTSLTLDSNGITATNDVDPNKYARLDYRGLYAKQGAIAIERPDGYLTLNDGTANFDFSIDQHEPPFIEDSRMSINGIWFRSYAYNWANCNYYSYKHTGRYLKILFAVKADSGTTGWVRVMDGPTELWKYSTTSTASYGVNVTATIDLGIPTGTLKSFYINGATGDSTENKAGYVRVLRKWLEG